MRLLVVIAAYPYGQRTLDYSYDYYNIYLPLRDTFDEVELFDFLSVQHDRGRNVMNAQLLQAVTELKPDAVFVVPTTDEIAPETIQSINLICPTIAYFHDDVWRFDYARYWAGYFSYVVTTNPYGESLFASAGLHNAIYSPRGYNSALYMPDPAIDLDIDISFVGGYAPYRSWLINRLRRAGMKVEVYGAGWDKAGLLPLAVDYLKRKARSSSAGDPAHVIGYLDQGEMISIFQRSRINLNLSNSTSWDIRYLALSGHGVINTLHSKKTREQIKGRHFEICGCGGFQLSYFVQGLEKCFELGTEMEVFIDPDDLVDKARFYLSHEAERAAIAKAGLRRAQQSHSIAVRLHTILQRVGLVGP